jgi:GR25 family glycosyltransferase involved in LPS biosynthesis
MEALLMAGDDAAVHMEDDVILVDGFRQALEQEIDQRPGKVIQFFSMRQADIEVGSRWDGNFIANLCFYLPATYSRQLHSYALTWPGRVKDPTGTDLAIRDFLKWRRESYWIRVPNLVDHRIAKSLIDRRRSSKRQSKSFVNPAP